MKLRNLLLGMVLTGTTSGCATAVPEIDYYSVDTEVLERIRGITVLDDASIAAGAYRSLGELEGMFCERNKLRVSPGPELERRFAVEQIKLRAAQLGADHISEPVCEAHSGLDMTNNCWSSTTCSAKALAIAD
jgi:hypothetical protein